MEGNTPQQTPPTHQPQPIPPNVPHPVAVQESGNHKPIVIGLVVAIVVVASGVAAFAWWKITTPQTEQKGTLPLSSNILSKDQIKAEILCGNPPEPLDASNMELSEVVRSLAVNEWYIDRNNSQESFIEIRNITANPIVTDGIEVSMDGPSLINEWPQMSHGGVLPVHELGPGCLMTLREKDLTPRQKAEGFPFTNSHSTGKIDGTFLIFGNRGGSDSYGGLKYSETMPAGNSISLTAAGKYVSAPKTPGAYNNAALTPAFLPSAAAVKYFKEIVPYVPRDKPDQRIVAKWKRSEAPVGLGGTLSVEDKACAENVVQELRTLTGLNMSTKNFDTKTGLGDAINLFIVPPGEFPEDSNNPQAISRPLWRGGAENINKIEEANVYVNVALPASEKCQLIYWGLGKALGVMQKSASHSTSMFNINFAPAPGYAEIDKEIIRMLYDRLIEPGDTPADINRVYPG